MSPKKYYHPLYESPLEELFAVSTKPFLKRTVKILPQFEILTDWGKFRLDFLFIHRKKLIAVECDGISAHDENAQIYDAWRDVICLSQKAVNVIYRFSGDRLFNRILDAVYLFYKYEHQLFRIKTFNEIENKIKPETKNVFESLFFESNFSVEIPFNDAQTENGQEIKPGFISIKKHADITADQKVIYNFLKENKGKRINTLIYKYFNQ